MNLPPLFGYFDNAYGLLIDQVLILILALVMDLILAEPRKQVHPVVWIGRTIAFFDKKIKRGNPGRERRAGVTSTLAAIAIFSIPCLSIYLIRPYSEVFYILVSAWIFKTTFAVRSLEKHAINTTTEDLDEKRHAAAMMVSRDTSKLSSEHLDSATIESVAENLTDSVISPLFYYAFFGVFGAMVYRVVNTLDAMIGYKNARYLHFGRFAARLDTALNLVPEVIASWLICLTSGNLTASKLTLKKHSRKGLKRTICAMSGALDIGLEKPGCYAVGGTVEGINKNHILKSISIMKRSTYLFAGITILILILVYLGGWTWLNHEVHWLVFHIAFTGA